MTLCGDIGYIAVAFFATVPPRYYTKAEAMMSAVFRAATPPAHLKMLLKGANQPFRDAKRLQFDSAKSMSHGTRAALRAHFLESDGKPYRTNFLLFKAGPTWLMSDLLPPTGQKTSKSMHGQGIAKL